MNTVTLEQAQEQLGELTPRGQNELRAGNLN